MNNENSYLQEVDQVFDVHVDTHPLVVNSGHIDEYVVANDFPGAIQYENKAPIKRDSRKLRGPYYFEIADEMQNLRTIITCPCTLEHYCKGSKDILNSSPVTTRNCSG